MRLPTLPCLLALLGTMAACGGGGGGPAPTGGATAATLSLLVGDAPTSTLSSLRVGLESVRLLRSDGTTTPELLATPAARDLLALQTVSELLRVTSLAAGTYTGARIVVADGSLAARDLQGVPVPVQLVEASVDAPLGTPLTVNAGDQVKLRLDIDLDASLSVAGAGLAFAVRASGERRSGSGEPIDEIHGFVVSASPAARSLEVDVVERESGVITGRLTLVLAPGARLFDDDEQMFATEAAFFAAATPGTRIEADGVLEDDNTFTANVVELEDGSRGVAKIKGSIVSIDQGAAVLRMQIREVRRGSAVVGPVLAALGQPAAIDVGFAGARIRIEGAASRPGSPLDLMPGQEIEVEFSAFASEPFPAREIEIEDENVGYEGTVIDTAGLPASFVLRLEPHDPAVRSGRVQAPVRVDLDGSERLYLKLGHEPVVSQNALFVGGRVRVRGLLDGPSTAATLAADDVRIRPGRLEGAVTGLTGTPVSLAIDIEDLDDPFGAGALPDPVMGLIAPGARITGDVSTVAELRARWNGGAAVEVRAYGTNDGATGIEIHELRVDVR